MSARIQLCNPTSNNWTDFIRANAITARNDALARKLNPRTLTVKRGGLLRRETGYAPYMAMKNGRTGWDLYICGAGPSLAHWRDWLELARDKATTHGKVEVWACNSALTYLLDEGAYVTHGFGIDQTDGLTEEWASTPDVAYYVASTVNPNTVGNLLAAGRKIIWFHNYVGVNEEKQLYTTLWPDGVMVGDGLNSVNRALCLGQFLNFKRIWVLGADCALGPGYTLHANGDDATARGATSVVMEGEVDGDTWSTKPDMLFSAVQLARWAATRHNLEIVGHVLPHALLNEALRHPGGWAEYLDSVARLDLMRGVRAPGAQGVDSPRGRNVSTDLFRVRDLSKGGAYLGAPPPALTSP